MTKPYYPRLLSEDTIIEQFRKGESHTRIKTLCEHHNIYHTKLKSNKISFFCISTKQSVQNSPLHYTVPLTMHNYRCSWGSGFHLDRKVVLHEAVGLTPNHVVKQLQTSDSLNHDLEAVIH